MHTSTEFEILKSELTNFSQNMMSRVYAQYTVRQMASIVFKYALRDDDKKTLAQDIIEQLMPLLFSNKHILVIEADKAHCEMAELYDKEYHDKPSPFLTFMFSDDFIESERAFDEWREERESGKNAIRENQLEAQRCKLISIAAISLTLQRYVVPGYVKDNKIKIELSKFLDKVDNDLQAVSEQTINASNNTQVSASSKSSSSPVNQGMFKRQPVTTEPTQTWFKLPQSKFNQLVKAALKAYPHYDMKSAKNQDYESDDDEMWSHQAFNETKEPNLSKFVELYSSILNDAYMSHPEFDKHRELNPMIMMQSMTTSLFFAQTTFHQAYQATLNETDPHAKEGQFIEALINAINAKFETEYGYEASSTSFSMQCRVM